MTNNDVLMLATARTLANSGDALRTRQEAGLSLREVGDAIGASPTTVWRWERGQRSPRGAAAVEWARLMGQLKRRGRVRQA